MRLLLDTHVLVWVLNGQRISPAVRSAIRDPENAIAVSAATIWELSIKAGLGRLTLPHGWFDELAKQAIDVLPITAVHALVVRDLPSLHRDPFDRMLVAQAGVEGLVLATRDQEIQRYEVDVLVA